MGAGVNQPLLFVAADLNQVTHRITLLASTSLGQLFLCSLSDMMRNGIKCDFHPEALATYLNDSIEK